MSGLRKKKSLLGGAGASNSATTDVKPEASSSPSAKSASAISEQNARELIGSWKKPEGGPVKDIPFTEEEITLAQIIVDTDNARTRHILQANPLVNKLEKNHPDYAENQATIEGLRSFAEHLKVEPLQTRIGIYPYKGRYKTAWGARRTLAMRIAFGDRYQIPCKVYDRKPDNVALVRFIENFQREDLSLLAKIMDFKPAAKLLLDRGDSVESVISHLGISKSLYHQFVKISENASVMKAIAEGLIRTKAQAVEIAKSAKTDADVLALLGEASAEPSQPIKTKPPGKKGRARTSISLPKLKGETGVKTMQRIVNGELKKMDWSGVTWDTDNLDQIQERLERHIEYLISDSK